MQPRRKSGVPLLIERPLVRSLLLLIEPAGAPKDLKSRALLPSHVAEPNRAVNRHKGRPFQVDPDVRNCRVHDLGAAGLGNLPQSRETVRSSAREVEAPTAELGLPLLATALHLSPGWAVSGCFRIRAGSPRSQNSYGCDNGKHVCMVNDLL